MKLLVPLESETDVEDVARDLVAAENLQPFEPTTLDFAAELSSRLLTDPAARAYPELQVLGFWLRRAELLKLKEQFKSLESDACVLVPRGIVLHVPPGNVDTLFSYTWMLALVTGNRNIVRLSQRESPVAELLCRMVRQLLGHDAFSRIRAATRFVRYGHDEQVTLRLSSVCDVRVLWGGDASVNRLRAVPLPPSARELTFPDRWSLCAIHSRAWLTSSDSERAEVAQQFFNDAFWFGQLACSSPRLVLFCGSAEEYPLAAESFFTAAAEAARRRNFRWETGTVLEKILFAHRAVLDQDVVRMGRFGNELTVLYLPGLAALDRHHPGGGVVFSAHVHELLELAPHVERRDQTLSVFGFEPEQLTDLVRTIGGRGIDRIVPIGRALSFDRFWDGYDLLQEFTRRISIRPN